MLVWYDPRTGEIVGLSSVLFDSSRRVPKQTRATAVGPRGAECLDLPDDEQVARGPDDYRVQLDEARRPLGLVRDEKSMIELSSDAVDSNGDGVGEIPAGGGQCTIVASLRASGKLSREGLMRVHFVATGGVLSHGAGETKSGGARVQLSSVQETKRVWVEARAPGFRAARVPIDFSGQV